MTAWDKGPAAVFGPGGGETFWQPQPTGGHVVLTMTPENFPHDHSACGFQVIPPGGRIELQAHKAAEKMWYVQDGRGELEIDGETHRLRPGSFVAMGRKVPHRLVNDGDGDLSLFFWVTPPGYEGLLEDWGRPRIAGEASPAFEQVPVEGRRAPLAQGVEAEKVGQASDKGRWVVVEPESGSVLWQFPPAGGYIQWKASSASFPTNRLFACIQVLPPGGQIPPHAHPRHEEWLLVRKGRGTVFVDEVAHDVEPGSIAFVDRWVVHSFRNDSDEPMELFVVFTPPGLEDALPSVSLAKNDGYETEPDWNVFLVDFPMPSSDVIDEMWASMNAAIVQPHIAKKHNDEAAGPVVH